MNPAQSLPTFRKLFTALVCGLSLFLNHSVRGADPGIEEVRRAWARRAEQAISFESNWTEERFVQRGAWTPPDMRPPEGNSPIRPENDLRLSHRYRLISAGDRFRFETYDYEWSEAKRDVVPRTVIYTFDGTTATRYFTTEILDSRTATIFRGNDGDESNFGVRPLTIHFRGNTQRGFDLNSAVASEEKADPLKPDQLRLKLLTVNNPRTNKTPRIDRGHLVLVDPARDFVVTRISLVRYPVVGPPEPTYQISISYEKDTQNEWFPVGWSYINSFNPLASISGKATVTQLLKNDKYEKEVFQFNQFDPGTIIQVRDERGLSKERFIMMRDGTQRVLDRSEWGKTREELLQ